VEFLNPWMLAGLGAVSIPIIIHLLNRRRYDVVEWGAMQFLKISEVTRRRLLIEELLLLLLRMGLIAVLVLALAAPVLTRNFLGRLARANRDVVLVIDGSASMASTGTPSGRSPHELAKEWALAFLGDLQAGDSVAVLQAKQQVVPIVGEPSVDLERVRNRINDLSAPAGGCDWPAAVQAAEKLLAKASHTTREIILLTDGQRQGWADPATLLRWEFLAAQEKAQAVGSTDTRDRPHLVVVNLDPDRKTNPPNWALTPLRINRPVVPAEREVLFRSDLDLRGQAKYEPPHRLRLEIDGKHIRDLKPPATGEITNGKMPFSFTHRFTTIGSHLVSVILEVDPPVRDRPDGYVVRDHVPADNRQDFALEVVAALPVLIVDGDTSATASERSTDFLVKALTPKGDPHPVVQARVVSVSEFDPAMLAGPGADKKGSPGLRPRVLILSNVAKLTGAQAEAIGLFLADGGGVLVTLGERVEPDSYNDDLYRGGQGWLPAKLGSIDGDEAKPQEAVRPVPALSTHPVLDIFREVAGVGGLGAARFPRWWKVSTSGKDAPGVVVATLRSPRQEVPFLVERVFRSGRVLLCTVPLDTSWGANLPKLPAYVPLAHELVYYLAGARSAEYNLQPGQPIRWRTEREKLTGFTLETPGHEPRPLSDGPVSGTNVLQAQLVRQPRGMQMLFEDTREPGPYRLQVPQRVIAFCNERDAVKMREAGAFEAGGDSVIARVRAGSVDGDVFVASREMSDQLAVLEPLLGPRGQMPGTLPGTLVDSADLADAVGKAREKTVWYVVQPDPAEADLTPATEDEKGKVASFVPLEYENDRGKIVASLETITEKPEIWWWFLLGLLGLLCAEVWMTRRMVKNR
jgi:hypothetical protein